MILSQVVDWIVSYTSLDVLKLKDCSEARIWKYQSLF